LDLCEDDRHDDVAPLLTPQAIVNGTVEWKPSGEISLLAAGRYVSEAQLDNTGNPDFRTPDWFNLDLQASVSLRKLVRHGEPRIRVHATNLLDNKRIWPAGYSYLFFTRDAGHGHARRHRRTTIRRPRAACTRRSTCASEVAARGALYVADRGDRRARRSGLRRVRDPRERLVLAVGDRERGRLRRLLPGRAAAGAGGAAGDPGRHLRLRLVGVEPERRRGEPPGRLEGESRKYWRRSRS
jgi:hypothetical protein